MNNTCFIFGALPVAQLNIKPTNKDFIIAADKGYLTTRKFKIEPNLIIGDFDSLGFIPDTDNTTVLPIRKDDTDVGYAIKTAIEKGYTKIIIYGALGEKIDHTLANIQLCAYCADNNINAIFISGNCRMTAIKNKTAVFKNAQGRMSVFCIGGCAHGVTLKGMLYPLENADMLPTYPLGVSNEFCCHTSEVSISDGTLVIFWYNNTLPEIGDVK